MKFCVYGCTGLLGTNAKNTVEQKMNSHSVQYEIGYCLNDHLNCFYMGGYNECCCVVTKLCSTLFRPWDSPGKSTGTVAISLSRGSSWPRDQTHISCIAGSFFTAEPPGKACNEYTIRDFENCFGEVSLAEELWMNIGEMQIQKKCCFKIRYV